MTRVTVAIAAYTAQENITKLLHAITHQTTCGFELIEVLVHCDGREDGTAELARAYSQDTAIPVRIIETIPRQGYAQAMQTIYTHATGEVLITLNDDIEILDMELFCKVVSKFQDNPKIGMVTGRPAYLKSRTYFGQALAAVQRAYHTSQYKGASSSTARTVDGKLMAFSQAFYSSFQFPLDKALVGNVDCYLYFSAITTGFEYAHAYEAVVYGRNPESVADYVQFSIRCSVSNIILNRNFDPTLIAREYAIPSKEIVKGLRKEIFRNPLKLLFVFVINQYVKWKVSRTTHSFSPVWDTINTARKLE